MPDVTKTTYVEPAMSYADPRDPRSNDRPWVAFTTAHGTLRYCADEVRAQFYDTYGRQREVVLGLRYRTPGAPMDGARTCALSVYTHPFRGAHGHDPIVLPRDRARRIYDRMIELAEHHPILLMNDECEGCTRGAWEGMVRFMDSIIMGSAHPSVRLLP